MNARCVVVIGHVDHGKTSLVRALTGIETDRLAEEKERGLSIALGFAHCTYATGTIDFIDAPGHEDFIQAMVSGATGAQSALVVISLSEGIGAQTLEHLHIAGLLGLGNAVVAVTKSDRLPPQARAERLDAIRSALAQTAFGTADLVVCSALTGEGLEALHAALQQTQAHPAPAPVPLDSFLPIDRVFTMTGHGTVVTGTLLGQPLNLNADAVVYPSGRSTSIRGLQSRGKKRDQVQAGTRVAVNLRDLATKDIPRGSVLCLGGTFGPSTCFDVEISLSEPNRTLKHAQELRVMFGTSSETASLRLYGAKKLAAGQSAYAQLRFAKPVVGFAGQACVLRRLSPPETIGGATLLDPLATPTRPSNAERLAVLEAARAHDPVAVGQALSKAQGGVARLSDLARLSRKTAAATKAALGDAFASLGPEFITPKETVKSTQTQVLAGLAHYHQRHPLHVCAPRGRVVPEGHPALMQHVIAALITQGRIRTAGQQLALCSHDPMHHLDQNQRARLDEITHIYQRAGLSPPTSETVAQSPLDADLTALLLHQGTLTLLSNVGLKQSLIFHRAALDAAAVHLRSAFPSAQPFTTSQARTTLDTSRRVIVPVLEHFDALGITTRKGDSRQINSANPVSATGPL